jgi:hypothetical protein
LFSSGDRWKKKKKKKSKKEGKEEEQHLMKEWAKSI